MRNRHLASCPNYPRKPSNTTRSASAGHGIDLAISQKESAEYTTNVTGEVFYLDDKPPYRRGDTLKVFIRPKPYNEHVTFHDFL